MGVRFQWWTQELLSSVPPQSDCWPMVLQAATTTITGTQVTMATDTVTTMGMTVAIVTTERVERPSTLELATWRAS